MEMEKETISAEINRNSDDVYADILKFAKENVGITYSAFSEASAWNLKLFAIRESFDFKTLEDTLDKITLCIPAIRRIFARPIIRLQDRDDIMPVESVHIVSSKTIVHASAHSELWSDINEDGILPRKLLTTKSDDHYRIYENLVFARVINILLSFVRANMRTLAEMLYADRDLSFNLLDRLDHPEYYLAIGKLHIGYVSDYDKYRTEALRCLDKLSFIDKVLRSRLGDPLYKTCKDFKGALVPKRTNIFRNHKDYHRIYKLYKWLYESNIDKNDSESSTVSEEGYFAYTLMLSLFAAGHFNFRFEGNESLDFSKLSVSSKFKGWTLNIESSSVENIPIISLNIEKDLNYRIIIVPCTETQLADERLAKVKAHTKASEYLLAGDSADTSALCLAVHDVESFRRIQQIIFRGMIYSDREREICPFCGNRFEKAEEHDTHTLYKCSYCRTRVLDTLCPESETRYSAVGIKNLAYARKSEISHSRLDSLILERHREGRMHFRNITPLTDTLGATCPHCGKVHITFSELCGSNI